MRHSDFAKIHYAYATKLAELRAFIHLDSVGTYVADVHIAIDRNDAPKAFLAVYEKEGREVDGVLVAEWNDVSIDELPADVLHAVATLKERLERWNKNEADFPASNAPNVAALAEERFQTRRRRLVRS